MGLSLVSGTLYSVQPNRTDGQDLTEEDKATLETYLQQAKEDQLDPEELTLEGFTFDVQPTLSIMFIGIGG